MGEPAIVLRDIGRQAGVKRYGGEREWLVIMCDGLPYTLSYQLIERFMQCSEGRQHVNRSSEAADHALVQHPGLEVIFEKEFGWILLQPGPGHINMNMLKSYVKLMWGVYWEDMVEIFYFKSEIAKKSVLKVSDHHKG